MTLREYLEKKHETASAKWRVDSYDDWHAGFYCGQMELLEEILAELDDKDVQVLGMVII
jgi:hypothetical protein